MQQCVCPNLTSLHPWELQRAVKCTNVATCWWLSPNHLVPFSLTSWWKAWARWKTWSIHSASPSLPPRRLDRPEEGWRTRRGERNPRRWMQNWMLRPRFFLFRERHRRPPLQPHHSNLLPGQDPWHECLVPLVSCFVTFWQSELKKKKKKKKKTQTATCMIFPRGNFGIQRNAIWGEQVKSPMPVRFCTRFSSCLPLKNSSKVIQSKS